MSSRFYLNGSIPDKIKIVSGLPREFTWGWDNYTVSHHYETHKAKLTAFEAFVCDAKESQHVRTAIRHAIECSGPLARQANQTFDPKTFKPDIVEMENRPFSDVRVVGAQDYANKTTYYVSFHKDKYCFEIESDALMDAITIGGVEGTGHLKGEFLFVRVQGRVKLVRIGSAYHKACVEANERKKVAAVDKFELVPGKVYQTKTGAKSLFLGFVNTYNLTFTMSEDQRKLFTAANTWNPTVKEMPVNWNTGLHVNNIFWKMATLWVDVWAFDQASLEKTVSEILDAGTYMVSRVELRKTHSFIEEAPGSPHIDIDIQAVFENCRQYATKHITDIKTRLASDLKAINQAKQNRVNDLHAIPECFSKEAVSYPLPPGLTWEVVREQAAEFNKQHKDELFELSKFFKIMNYEADMMKEAPKANMIVYGMPPVVNPHLQEIMAKYNNGVSL